MRDSLVEVITKLNEQFAEAVKHGITHMSLAAVTPVKDGRRTFTFFVKTSTPQFNSYTIDVTLLA